MRPDYLDRRVRRASKKLRVTLKNYGVKGLHPQPNLIVTGCAVAVTAIVTGFDAVNPLIYNSCDGVTAQKPCALPWPPQTLAHSIPMMLQR
jgi:hypothetical protein